MRYDKYKLNIKEIFISVFIWAAASALLSYFFYRSLIAGVIIFIFFPVFLIFVKKISSGTTEVEDDSRV